MVISRKNLLNKHITPQGGWPARQALIQWSAEGGAAMGNSNETARIADQLHRALVGGNDEAEGDAWHGPAVETLLADVDASRAAARPVPGAHSIWELVQHMTVWLETVRRRLEENRAIEPAPEENWAPVPAPSGEEAWRRTLERHRRAGEDLRRLAASLQDSRLEQGVAGKDYDAYVMLHGIVQHELYHAGQIALLKKALGL
jgi:uncharacterized damage-inducible protein DinB